MPRPEKVQAVEQIKKRFEEAEATFVTEYRGLSVARQQQLRRSITAADGEYKVLKMSLTRRATEDMNLEGLEQLLVGPTALAFAASDPVLVAKALQDFAGEDEGLIIKGGIFAGEVLKPEQISRLAEIEPREVLLTKIAGGAKAPLVRLAGLLGSKLREAASLFSQLLEKKESESGRDGPDGVETAPEAVEEAAAVEGTAAADEEADAAPPGVTGTGTAAAEETPAQGEPVAGEGGEPGRAGDDSGAGGEETPAGAEIENETDTEEE